MAIEKFNENQERPEHLGEFEDHTVSLPQNYYINIYHPKGKEPWFAMHNHGKFGDMHYYKNGKWTKD